jgi:hypothetical protein
MNEDSRWGFIDMSGEVVIPFEYESAFNFSNGYARVWLPDDGTLLYINTKGEIVDPPLLNSGDLVMFFDADSMLWGYKNESDEIVIPAQFGDARDFSEGLAAVFNGANNQDNTGRWGHIDMSGEVVIPFMYVRGGDFNDGVATVVYFNTETNQRSYGFINKNNEQISPFGEYSEIVYVGNGLAVGWKDNLHGIFTISGDVVFPFGEYFVNFFGTHEDALYFGVTVSYHRMCECCGTEPTAFMGQSVGLIAITRDGSATSCDDCGNDPCDCPEPCECGCCSDCGLCGECDVCDPPVVGCGDCGDCSDCNPTPEVCDICENDPCDCPEVCDCLNCPDCGYLGGRFGFGNVTNNPTGLVVQDAIAILRHLLELPSALDERD